MKLAKSSGADESNLGGEQMTDVIRREVTLDEIKNLPHGTAINALTISKLSGMNQVKGIHPITMGGQIKAVVILCTIGGENYPNEWLDKEKRILKYFLEGRMDKNKEYKSYNLNIASNRSIIESNKVGYPVYVFSRNQKQKPFLFEGEFYFNGVLTDKNGRDKYFELVMDEIQEQQPNSEKTDIQDYLETTKEGRRVLRQHFARERDSKVTETAKKQYKEKYGILDCEACGFNFHTIYGDRGKEYIEGHHTIPISSLDEQGGETKVEDIALLCANCHKMIHRYKPWLTVEELKSSIRY
jgi:hypothetical protein